ncbi:glycosyltransferase, partial [Streptomyces flaveolus]|uniref:scabin-related ADP-ribosyltransferase n=1 Tax=Streptomyces flaveolus TaxID=67297 RepID=UPI0033E10A27
MIVAQVVQFLFEWALTLVLAIFNPVQAAIEQTFLRALYRLILRSLLLRLLATVVAYEGLNVGLSSVMDLLVRWSLAAEGKSTRYGGQYASQAAGFGAVQGAFAVFVPYVGSSIAGLLAKDISRSIEDVVGRALAGGPGDRGLTREATTGLTREAGAAANRGAVGGAERGVIGGSGAGGFAREVAAGSAGIAQRFEMGEVDALVASSFKDDMARVFTGAFADTLGQDAARGLGERWADVFLTHFGSRRFGDELFRSLGGLENQSLRSALSHGVAGALSRDWRRKVSGYTGDALANAGHQNVSEGFYNLFTTGRFTTTWETGASGAAGGTLSHLMSANAHRIGRSIRTSLGLDGTDKFDVPMPPAGVNPQPDAAPGGAGAHTGVGKSSFYVTPKSDASTDYASDAETLVGDRPDDIGQGHKVPTETGLSVPALSGGPFAPGSGAGDAGDPVVRLLGLPQVGRFPAPGSAAPDVSGPFPADTGRPGVEGVREPVAAASAGQPVSGDARPASGDRAVGGTASGDRGVGQAELAGVPQDGNRAAANDENVGGSPGVSDREVTASGSTNGSAGRVPTLGGPRNAGTGQDDAGSGLVPRGDVRGGRSQELSGEDVPADDGGEVDRLAERSAALRSGQDVPGAAQPGDGVPLTQTPDEQASSLVQASDDPVSTGNVPGVGESDALAARLQDVSVPAGPVEGGRILDAPVAPGSPVVSPEVQVGQVVDRLEVLAREVQMPGDERAAHVRAVREAAAAGDWRAATQGIGEFRERIVARDLRERYEAFSDQVAEGFERVEELGVGRQEWQERVEAVREAWQAGDLRVLEDSLRDYTGLIERHVPVDVLSGDDLPTFHDPDLARLRRQILTGGDGRDVREALGDYLRLQPLSDSLRSRLEEAVTGHTPAEEAVLRQRMLTASSPEESAAAARELQDLRAVRALQQRLDGLRDDTGDSTGDGPDGFASLERRLEALRDTPLDARESELRRQIEEAESDQDRTLALQALHDYRNLQDLHQRVQALQQDDETGGAGGEGRSDEGREGLPTEEELRERFRALTAHEEGPAADLRHRILDSTGADEQADRQLLQEREELVRREEAERQERVRALREELAALQQQHQDQQQGLLQNLRTPTHTPDTPPQQPPGSNDSTSGDSPAGDLHTGGREVAPHIAPVPAPHETARRIEDVRRRLDKELTEAERLAELRQETTISVPRLETNGHLQRIVQRGLAAQREQQNPTHTRDTLQQLLPLPAPAHQPTDTPTTSDAPHNLADDHPLTDATPAQDDTPPTDATVNHSDRDRDELTPHDQTTQLQKPPAARSPLPTDEATDRTANPPLPPPPALSGLDALRIALQGHLTTTDLTHHQTSDDNGSDTAAHDTRPVSEEAGDRSVLTLPAAGPVVTESADLAPAVNYAMVHPDDHEFVVESRPGERLWRFSDHAPEEVFEEGFHGNDPESVVPLWDWVTVNPDDAPYVATTRDRNLWHEEKRYRYRIESALNFDRTGVDVNATVPWMLQAMDSPSDEAWAEYDLFSVEHEVAFTGAIHPRAVVSVYDKENDRTGVYNPLLRTVAWLDGELDDGTHGIPADWLHAYGAADVAPAVTTDSPADDTAVGTRVAEDTTTTADDTVTGTETADIRTAGTEELGERYGAGEVSTDRWRPFGSRGRTDLPQAFVFTLAANGTLLSVRRPPASGERTEVGYTWAWHRATTPAGDVLHLTRRIHLRDAGASPEEMRKVQEGLVRAIDIHINAHGYRMPVLQPDRITGAMAPGPVLRVSAEFTDAPGAAHTVVDVRPGRPGTRHGMDQGVWHAGVYPGAWVHEFVHGLGVWDDEPDTRTLLVPGGRGEQVLDEGESSLMSPLTGMPPSRQFRLTQDHLTQIAAVFAPHAHAGEIPAPRGEVVRQAGTSAADEQATDLPAAVDYQLIHRDDIRLDGVEGLSTETLWRFSEQGPESVFVDGFRADDVTNVVDVHDWTGDNPRAQFVATTRDADLWYGNKRYRYRVDPARKGDTTGVDMGATLAVQGDDLAGINVREAEMAFTGELSPEAIVGVYDREEDRTGTFDATTRTVTWRPGGGDDWNAENLATDTALAVDTVLHPDERDLLVESGAEETLWRFSRTEPETVFQAGFRGDHVYTPADLREWAGRNPDSPFAAATRARDLWYGLKPYRYRVEAAQDRRAAVSVYDHLGDRTGTWDPAERKVLWVPGDATVPTEHPGDGQASDAEPAVNYRLIHPEDRRHVRESHPSGETLWRFSDRHPSAVLLDGFPAEDADRVVRVHDWATQEPKAQFVSTTRDPALWFLSMRYRYEIVPARNTIGPAGTGVTGVDVNATLRAAGQKVPFPSEQEIAFTGGISAEAVVSVYDQVRGLTGELVHDTGEIFWARGDRQNSSADRQARLPSGWAAPAATQSALAPVRAADRPSVWASGEVRTDRWMPFGTRRGARRPGVPEAFVFSVSEDGTPVGVRRPSGSGERIEVGYAWQWLRGETPARDTLYLTRRVHLSPDGATDAEVLELRQKLTRALDQLVNEAGHRLPVGQPDQVTGPRQPGPLLRLDVEFTDRPEDAHTAVTVRPGLPETDRSMTQRAWYTGVHPAAYVHELVHGLGVRDDEPGPDALLTFGSRGGQHLAEGATSLMGPFADAAGLLWMTLADDHLRQIADVFAPYAHGAQGTAGTAGAREAASHDTDSGRDAGTELPDVETRVAYSPTQLDDAPAMIGGLPETTLWRFSNAAPEEVFARGFGTDRVANMVDLRDTAAVGPEARSESIPRDLELLFQGRRYRYRVEPLQSAASEGVAEGGTLVAHATPTREEEATATRATSPTAVVGVYDRQEDRTGTWDAGTETVVWRPGSADGWTRRLAEDLAPAARYMVNTPYASTSTGATAPLTRSTGQQAAEEADLGIVDNWLHLSSLPGKTRSRGLKAVDAAVRTVTEHPGDPGAVRRALDAIRDWESGKGGGSDRREAVERLRQELIRLLDGGRSAAAQILPLPRTRVPLAPQTHVAAPQAGRAAQAQLVEGRAGAAGFEAELHEYGVLLPPDASEDDYDVLVDTPTLTITLDMGAAGPILEVVSKATRVLSGAADDGRQEKSAVLAQFDDVLTRLRKARANDRLDRVFPAEAGYRVDPLAGELRLRPGAKGPTERLFLHYTVGIPLAGIIPFLEHVRQQGRQDTAITQAAQGHLADALRFGRETASPFHQWLAANLEFQRLARPDDVPALEGFLALAYTQVAALAQGTLSHVNMPKNFSAVTSRVSLAGARAGLGTAGQFFLEEHATTIARHFADSFRSYFKEVRDVPDILADWIPPRWAGDRRSPGTIGQYLANALLARPDLFLGQDTALGVRTDFQELDHNRLPDGTPRLDPPVVVLELRSYGTRYASRQDLLHNYATLEGQALRLYNEARQLRGLNAVGRPLPPVAADPVPGPSGPGRVRRPIEHPLVGGAPRAGQDVEVDPPAAPRPPVAALRRRLADGYDFGRGPGLGDDPDAAAIARIIGPDIYGQRQAPPAPSFLRGYDFARLKSTQRAAFFTAVDMTRRAPLPHEVLPSALRRDPGTVVESGKRSMNRATARGLRKAVRIPRLVHTVWLGGPLRDHGATAGFRRNIAAMATGQPDFTVVLWTDVSREEISAARAAAKRPAHATARSRRTAEVLDMLDWARTAGVRLVNVDEIFSTASPMELQGIYKAEESRRTGAAYAAASDVLRLEILSRFGGVYTDGDNTVSGDLTGEVRRVADSAHGFGMGDDGAGRRSNAVLIAPAGHDFLTPYRDVIRGNYTRTAYESMYRAKQLVFDAEVGDDRSETRPLAPEVLGRTRRTVRDEVLYRTGPSSGVLRSLARRIGLPNHLDGLIPLSSRVFTVNSAQSWLPPDTPTTPAPIAAEPYDAVEAARVTREVLVFLVQGLHRQPGNLDLAGVASAVRGLPRPDDLWDAVIGFLAERAELRTLVRSVTLDTLDGGESGIVDTVRLPAWSSRLLEILHEAPRDGLAAHVHPARLRAPDERGQVRPEYARLHPDEQRRLFTEAAGYLPWRGGGSGAAPPGAPRGAPPHPENDGP